MPPVLHIPLNILVLCTFDNMSPHRLPVIIHQAQAVLQLIPEARRAPVLIISAPRDKTGIVHLISQPVAKQRIPFLYSGAKPYSLRKSRICSHDRPAQPHSFPRPGRFRRRMPRFFKTQGKAQLRLRIFFKHRFLYGTKAVAAGRGKSQLRRTQAAAAQKSP